MSEAQVQVKGDAGSGRKEKTGRYGTALLYAVRIKCEKGSCKNGKESDEKKAKTKRPQEPHEGPGTRHEFESE